MFLGPLQPSVEHNCSVLHEHVIEFPLSCHVLSTAALDTSHASPLPFQVLPSQPSNELGRRARTDEATIGARLEIPAIYVYPTGSAPCARAVPPPGITTARSALRHFCPRSDSSNLTRSLRHEYVHHALVSNGIELPMWLQEGAAMTRARRAAVPSPWRWKQPARSNAALS